MGRLRAVSLSDWDYLQSSDAFDNTSKVRRWTEGHHSAAVLCGIVCVDLLFIFELFYVELSRGRKWHFAAMSTSDSDGSHFLGTGFAVSP